MADHPTKWANFLPWAELALNCFHHEGLGTSPFRALYGREPPALIAAQPSPKRHDPEVMEIIRQRGELLVELRKNLERAQQKMRSVANRQRRDVNFAVGDKVLLKLQQYRQHSVAKPLSAMLARRYYGPFQVIEKIGPVAYRLELPPGARIHDVFHVSLLKPFVEGDVGVAITDLPRGMEGNQPVVRPTRVLNRRLALQDVLPVEQVLVEWGDGLHLQPSWEPLSNMQLRFPDLLADKELVNGEGVDTSTIVSPPNTTPTGNQEEEGLPSEPEEEEEEPEAQLEVQTKEDGRPKRQSKKPIKYGDFVPY